MYFCSFVFAAVDCGVPPSIQHGTINYMSTTLGSVAGYHCDEGFLPSGTRRRTCEASGQWSGRNITCQGMQTHVGIGTHLIVLVEVIIGKLLPVFL